jgi:hypothetical protein
MLEKPMLAKKNMKFGLTASKGILKQTDEIIR